LTQYQNVLGTTITSIDPSYLDNTIFPDCEIQHIADFIKSSEYPRQIIYSLLDNIPNYGKHYDWNIGNILQKIEPAIVITEFKKFNYIRFINSMGLTWACGEYELQDEFIIDFLYAVLNGTTNDNAWWRAGFAIGKIKQINPITLLKSALKSRGLNTIDYYLNNIDKKSSIIGTLFCSTNACIKNKIYPELKNKFLNDNSKLETLVNCVWLLGRLNLIDQEIYNKMEKIVTQCKDYELLHYTFFAIQENISDKFVALLKQNIVNNDPLIRKLAIRGLSNILCEDNIHILKDLLIVEKDESVIKEVVKSIYKFESIHSKNESLLLRKFCENENGLIIDESDKWYADPAIYNMFSEAEDPANLCFNLIKNKLLNENVQIKNPIDIACGTGRATRQILDGLDFKGVLTAVDINPKMIDFLNKSVDRRKDYTKNIQSIKSSITNLKLKEKSTLIISSFGFPSKTSDKNSSLSELKKIYSLLDTCGVFATIGWDETFNDELNYFWYKFLPDDIDAKSFEEWRLKRIEKIDSPRNCNLTWFKKGLPIPLQFSSINESAQVMGRLFGRDALEEILKHRKTQWLMSMGITYNTKEDLKSIIKGLENERN